MNKRKDRDRQVDGQRDRQTLPSPHSTALRPPLRAQVGAIPTDGQKDRHTDRPPHLTPTLGMHR